MDLSTYISFEQLKDKLVLRAFANSDNSVKNTNFLLQSKMIWTLNFYFLKVLLENYHISKKIILI